MKKYKIKAFPQGKASGTEKGFYNKCWGQVKNLTP